MIKGLSFHKILISSLIIFVLDISSVFAQIHYKKIDSVYASEVVYVQDSFLPIVNVDIAFKHAGFIADPNVKLGLTRVYLDLVNSFTFSKDFIELRNLLERKAIEMSFSADRRDFYISIKFIKSDYKYVAKLLAKFLNEKNFTEDFLNLSKHELITIREQKYKNSNYLASLNFQRAMFQNSKYAESSYGSEESIMRIGLDDVKNYQEQRFSRDNLYVSIVGDLEELKLDYFLRTSFAHLSQSSDLQKHQVFVNDNKFESVKFPSKEQVIIQSGTKAPARDSEDYYAFFLFDHIMGASGLTSRLGKSLREDKGLTYGANSYFTHVDDQAIWVLSFATDKEKYRAAITEIENIINNLKSNPISVDELNAAKEEITAEFSIYFATNKRISRNLLAAIVDGLNPEIINMQIDEINKVSLDQVNQAVADNIPHFDDFVTIIVGDVFSE